MAKKKSRIDILQSLICKGEKALKKWKKIEAKARAKWTRGYRSFITAAKSLANATIRQFETKKYERWAKTVSEWGEKNVEWTKERDQAREEIRKQEEKLQKLRVELASLIEKVEAEKKAQDEIINNVFSLNETVVQALQSRNEYLTARIYHKLIDEDGNLCRQRTFDRSDGLRRVVALVNSITIVDKELVDKAMKLMNKFFKKFKNEEGELPKEVQAMYDLTKQLLIEKISYKVGPTLSQFISMELDRETMPELYEAQILLRKSIRTEKTESYIQLYSRASRADKWVRLKLK